MQSHRKLYKVSIKLQLAIVDFEKEKTLDSTKSYLKPKNKGPQIMITCTGKSEEDKIVPKEYRCFAISLMKCQVNELPSLANHS